MSDITAGSIHTNVGAREDFGSATGGVQSPMETLKKDGFPMVRQAFGKAVDGIGNFAKENPQMAMWASFGLALLATPAVLNVLSHLPTTGKNLGKLALKIGAALAVANVAATWASNPEGGLTGALAKTGSDFGALLGFDGNELQAPVIESDPSVGAGAGAAIGSAKAEAETESPEHGAPEAETVEQPAGTNRASHDMQFAP